MNLAIDEAERELLSTLLHRHIGETRVGIRHARSNDFKDILRKEDTISNDLMEKLQKLVTTQ